MSGSRCREVYLPCREKACTAPHLLSTPLTARGPELLQFQFLTHACFTNASSILCSGSGRRNFVSSVERAGRLSKLSPECSHRAGQLVEATLGEYIAAWGSHNSKIPSTAFSSGKGERAGTFQVNGCKSGTWAGGGGGVLQEKLSHLEPQLQLHLCSHSPRFSTGRRATSTGIWNDHRQVFQVLEGDIDFRTSLLDCDVGLGTVLVRDFCHIIPHPKDREAM